MDYSNIDSNIAEQPSRRRVHRVKRERTSRQSQILILSLGAVLLLTFFISYLIVADNNLRISELTSQLILVQEQLRIKQQEIDGLKSPALLRSNLLKFVPDQVLAVNKDFVKNIVFSVTTHRGARIYDYKMVVENTSHKTIMPKFEVFIFDKDGVELGKDAALNSIEIASGESLSYSSKVDVILEKEPAYFRISSSVPAAAITN